MKMIMVMIEVINMKSIKSDKMIIMIIKAVLKITV